MEKTIVETPTGPYSFYPESGADLSTSEGRIAWFCAHFDVTPPTLQYDAEVYLIRKGLRRLFGSFTHRV
jgi:hypothetical protein